MSSRLLLLPAQYYDIPRVSYRNLCWEAWLRGRPGWNVTDLMTGDMRHPTDFGHTCARPFCRQPAHLEALGWACVL